jgi:hypothetical protein
MRRYPAQYRTRGVKGRQSKAEPARIGRTRMLDERESFKVIRLFKQDSKAIERALWETYYAIYALTFATELDGVEMEDSEIEEIVDELQRDLIFTMKEIRGYSEKARFALFELVKKHKLDGPRRSKQDHR